MPVPREVAPGLNPVENIWQYMRDNWLSNRVFKSYDHFVGHCTYAVGITLIRQTAPGKSCPSDYACAAHGFRFRNEISVLSPARRTPSTPAYVATHSIVSWVACITRTDSRSSDNLQTGDGMNVAVKAAKHAAPGPYLGFALQPVRLCYRLLTCPKGAQVSLEFAPEKSCEDCSGDSQHYCGFRRSTRRHAAALRLRFSQSLARRLHRPSHANVRSTTHRFGRTTNPFA